MKPWEREILEYRPKLGYASNILSVIEEQSEEATGKVFEPSPATRRAMDVLGTNAVDNLMASLSRASHILDTLDKCLGSDPNYQEYRSAKDRGDENAAHDAYKKNAMDINGKPQLDVIPLLDEIKEEMEAYLEFVNNELFDGELDYNDTSSTREQEEEMIDGILRRESEGKPVDYSKISSRTKTIASVVERTGAFTHIIDKADEYLLSNTKDYISEDTEGLLQYLTKISEEKIPLMKEALGVNFRRNASQSIRSRENMKRLGDRRLKESIDKQMSNVRKKLHEVYDGLYSEMKDDTLDSEGAELFKSIYESGVSQIKDTFDYLVTENITTSVLNREQADHFFESLREKKTSQSLHHLLTLFQEEFDRDHPEKEIPKFIKIHKLNTQGTYCG